MPRFETDSDARRLGEALATLRRTRGLSQAEAGQRAGMTSQGWGLYEAGRRPGLFRPDVQRRLTLALEATVEDLQLSMTRRPVVEPMGSDNGVESVSRAFAGLEPPKAELRRLRLSNDDLAPWAASGVVVEYATGRWPRRDQGCVIEMTDGALLVRVYERADDRTLTVRGGREGLAAEELVDRKAIAQVSAVVSRLDA